MTVICPLYFDTGLLFHFMKHYRDMGATQFVFGVWRGHNNPIWNDLSKDNTIKLIEMGETYHDLNGEVDFSNYAREQFVLPNDWYIITDLDEFHVMPGYNNMYDLIKDVESEGRSFVLNWIVDRTTVDGSLPPITGDSIWDQFPKDTYITKDLLKGCPHKVFMAKQNVEIWVGHHLCPDAGGCFSKWGKCYHFKWFGDLFEREKRKLFLYKQRGYGYHTENEILVKTLTENNGKLFKAE